MISFITDLDNTLIYSYKRELSADKVIIENKDGKVLSFMTKNSYDKLKHLNQKIGFIPLTTRSLEQYRRILFEGELQPEYALVANGAILLKNGDIVTEWYNETLGEILEAEEELKKAVEQLKQDELIYYDVKKIDGAFIFTKSKDIEVSIGRLEKVLNKDLIDIHTNGEKLYILPKKLNKGRALERLKRYLNLKLCVCAGDSEMDIPMLEEADMRIVPLNLQDNILNNTNTIVVDILKTNFSDKILEIVEKMLVDEVKS